MKKDLSYVKINKSKNKVEITAQIEDKVLDKNRVNATVKQVSKFLKRTNLKNKEIIINTNLDLNKDEKEDNQKLTLTSVLNACKIKDKNERLEYIYMAACKYLDNEYLGKNICEFCDDVCFEKRKYLKEGCCYENIRDGCCHRLTLKYLLSPKKTIIPRCIYQKDGVCTNINLGCKLFACKGVRDKGFKYTYYNVALVRYFFNIIQKAIIRCSVFEHQDKVLKRIKSFNF